MSLIRKVVGLESVFVGARFTVGALALSALEPPDQCKSGIVVAASSSLTDDPHSDLHRHSVQCWDGVAGVAEVAEAVLEGTGEVLCS